MVFDEKFLADVKASMESGKRIRPYLQENGLDFRPGEVRKALKDKYGEAVVTDIIKNVILVPENVQAFKADMQVKRQALKELKIQARADGKMVVGGKIVDKPVGGKDVVGKGVVGKII